MNPCPSFPALKYRLSTATYTEALGNAFPRPCEHANAMTRPTPLPPLALSLLLLHLLLCCPLAHAELTLVADVRAVQADSAGSGLDAALGKTRFDNSGVDGMLGLDLHADLDIWQLDMSALRYRGSDQVLALTEAFASLRPIPTSAWRQQLRAGFFYAPLSLENSVATWQAKGFLSSSAINTWLAEELRTLGIEWRWTRLGQFVGSDHDYSLFAAAFDHNDTAGSLLSWRGWSLHDRQLGWDETVDFAALPTFADTGPFRFQAPYTAPFEEVDHRVGYYIGADWQYRPQLRLSGLYYDNRGQPAEFDNGQYSWQTRFQHVSLHWQPNENWALLAQAMRGNTQMGRNVLRYVDNDFRAWYLSLARQWQTHRFSARYDNFRVADRDQTINDNNQEHGKAYTLAWHWQFSTNWQLLTEVQQIDSDRPARLTIAEAAEQREHLLQLALRFQF